MPNHHPADLLHEAMEAIGPIEFTPEEVAFAQKVNDTFPGTNETYVMRYLDYFKPDREIRARWLSHKDDPLNGAFFYPGTPALKDMRGFRPD